MEKMADNFLIIYGKISHAVFLDFWAVS